VKHVLKDKLLEHYYRKKHKEQHTSKKLNIQSTKHTKKQKTMPYKDIRKTTHQTKPNSAILKLFNYNNSTK